MDTEHRGTLEEGRSQTRRSSWSPRCSRPRQGRVSVQLRETPARTREACPPHAQQPPRARAACVSSAIGCSKPQLSSGSGEPSARGACPPPLDHRPAPWSSSTSFVLRRPPALTHTRSTPAAVRAGESAARARACVVRTCPRRKTELGPESVSELPGARAGRVRARLSARASALCGSPALGGGARGCGGGGMLAPLLGQGPGRSPLNPSGRSRAQAGRLVELGWARGDVTD
jgi:hypothetical protein